MKVVVAPPPMFDEIDAVFHVKGKPVIFAWGDTIYAPQGGPVSEALQAHEAVHGARQSNDIEGWWRRYMTDPAFRLAEEIPAHRAEYRWHAAQPNAHQAVKGFRSRLAFHEADIARRLSGPLYGAMISNARARTEILRAA